jgi:hypothetical protein
MIKEGITSVEVINWRERTMSRNSGMVSLRKPRSLRNLRFITENANSIGLNQGQYGGVDL